MHSGIPEGGSTLSICAYGWVKENEDYTFLKMYF
jgi:hypothetical protein